MTITQSFSFRVRYVAEYQDRVYDLYSTPYLATKEECLEFAKNDPAFVDVIVHELKTYKIKNSEKIGLFQSIIFTVLSSAQQKRIAKKFVKDNISKIGHALTITFCGRDTDYQDTWFVGAFDTRTK